MRVIVSIAALSIAVLGAPALAQKSPATSPIPVSAVDKIREEATGMREFVTSSLARGYLDAVAKLPEVKPVDVFIDRANRKYYTPTEAEALPEADRAKLEKRTLDENFYYNTKYGSPLAYARPLDLLAGFDNFKGERHGWSNRILDFGYGNIGQLHLLAERGYWAVGVDVDPLLVAYYSQHNEEFFKAGSILRSSGAGIDPSKSGIQLVNGQWPADPATAKKVGTGYDLFISKNTLKRGYVHPEREADKRMLIDLGVSDEQFLAKLHEILNPGGWVMIYNICPAPAPLDKPYIPWADGRCPFTQDALKAAGFEVIAFDHDDTEPARKMAHILGWDQGQGAMNLKDDLFAWYTILRKPDAK